jgi:hypothetical protein
MNYCFVAGWINIATVAAATFVYVGIACVIYPLWKYLLGKN